MANAASSMEPGRSYSLPSRKSGYPIAELFNDADNLVSRDDGRQSGIQLSFDNVKIGAADATSFDAQ
jgi:hypothetical protein